MTTAGKRKVPDTLSESVYNFLAKQGYDSAAKAFLKEASLDEKKIKAATVPDLVDIFDRK